MSLLEVTNGIWQVAPAMAENARAQRY